MVEEGDEGGGGGRTELGIFSKKMETLRTYCTILLSTFLRNQTHNKVYMASGRRAGKQACIAKWKTLFAIGNFQ